MTVSSCHETGGLWLIQKQLLALRKHIVVGDALVISIGYPAISVASSQQ